MNEWSFIGQDILGGIEKPATSFIFEIWRGYLRDVRLCFLIPTHPSLSLGVIEI